MTASPCAPTVLRIPAFQDNYLWLIHDGRNAAVVDPGDDSPIRTALQAQGLTLTAILLTHHHADHVGGVPGLLRRWNVPVFGPRHDGIAAVTHPLDDGDTVKVPGLDVQLRVLAVPGHTLGHIAYVRQDGLPRWLFCGDTLFAGGCGRLFEGTPAQMADSLAKLAALPDDTLVFCAHEYTLANLRFAAAAEPGNPAVRQRLREVEVARAHGQATVPSTIGLEKATNPFVRYCQPEIVHTLQQQRALPIGAAPAATFAALREWKNGF